MKLVGAPAAVVPETVAAAVRATTSRRVPVGVVGALFGIQGWECDGQVATGYMAVKWFAVARGLQKAFGWGLA